MATKGSKSKRRAGKRYQFEVTLLSMILWVFGLFFLLVWIFALGIFVGRGYFPGAVTALTDLKGQISRLQEMVGADKERERNAPGKEESDPKLAFFEKLASKRNEARKQGEPKQSSGPGEKEITKVVSRPEDKVPVKTQEKESSASLSDTAPSVVGGEQFTVQIASLTDKDGAVRMVRQLTARGYDTFYSVAHIKGVMHYRVRCGKFRDREEAENYALKIRKAEGLKGFVSRIE